MKRYEALETLFSKVDLSFAQKVLNEPFHPAGSPGRPQRNPLGLFKAHLVRRLKHIPSDRMLVRQMWKDPRLKKICDIEENEPPYGIAVLSRFRNKVGPERLARIVDQAVEVLVAKGRIKGEALALDSTFIKAYSRRKKRAAHRYDSGFGQREREETFHQPVCESIRIRKTKEALGRLTVQRSKSKGKRIGTRHGTRYSGSKKPTGRRQRHP